MFGRAFWGASFYGPRYFGDGGNEVPIPVVTRPPGGDDYPGAARPIIYVDKHGRPIDLDKLEDREVNKAIQVARREIKTLEPEEKAEAKQALRDLQNAEDRQALIAAAEELAGYVSAVSELASVLRQIEEYQRDEDDAIAILLLN